MSFLFLVFPLWEIKSLLVIVKLESFCIISGFWWCKPILQKRACWLRKFANTFWRELIAEYVCLQITQITQLEMHNHIIYKNTLTSVFWTPILCQQSLGEKRSKPPDARSVSAPFSITTIYHLFLPRTSRCITDINKFQLIFGWL